MAVIPGIPAHTCTPACRAPRHSVEALEFQGLGLACICGANRWRYLTGGALPTVLACPACFGQVNLERILRRPLYARDGG